MSLFLARPTSPALATTATASARCRPAPGGASPGAGWSRPAARRRGLPVLLAASLCLVLAGCASTSGTADAADPNPAAAESHSAGTDAGGASVSDARTPAAAGAGAPAGSGAKRPRSGRPAPPPKPATVDTAEAPLGRVVTANLVLKFAVIDFSLRPMPAVGVEMQLYRGVQRVGQVRISGPVLDGHIVADIIAGDAATGDEVRLD